ncbi:hypothetical protein RN001_015911 [Aquatica leii]|uniref:Uncharacterized protein n=1 Tax=Aquatica leii TaxID=1421715 RepID=A0AAN7SAY3_9COLE|nr:hypothetical protein RN001_015911 [Aquatica leii]
MIRRVERENICDREVKKVTEEKLERTERRMSAAQAEENTEDVRKEDLQKELRILKEKHQHMEKEYNTLKKEKKETDKKLYTKCKNNGSALYFWITHFKLELTFLRSLGITRRNGVA